MYTAVLLAAILMAAVDAPGFAAYGWDWIRILDLGPLPQYPYTPGSIFPSLVTVYFIIKLTRGEPLND